MTFEYTRTGYLIIRYRGYTRMYIGYSKREAIRIFREKFNLKGKHLK